MTALERLLHNLLSLLVAVRDGNRNPRNRSYHQNRRNDFLEWEWLLWRHRFLFVLFWQNGLSDLRFCFRLLHLNFRSRNCGGIYFFSFFLRLFYALFRFRRNDFNDRRSYQSIYRADDGLCLFRRPRRDHARTVHNGFDLPMPRHIVFPKRKLDPISDLERQASGQIRIRAACSLHLNGTIVIHRAVIGFRVLNGLAGI